MISQLELDIIECQKERLCQLNQLDELRQEALFHSEVVHQQRKGWNDKFIKAKLFKEGDWVVLYDSRYKYFKGKLMTRWLGTYQIETRYPNGSVKIKTIDESTTPLLVNGYRLKLYKKPITKQEFIDNLQNQDFGIIGSLQAPQPA